MEYDCLLIGHNEMDFSIYEENVRKMGQESEAYQNLLFDCIKVDGRLKSVCEVLNSGICKDDNITLGETFSATIAYLVSFAYRKGIKIDYIRDFQRQKEDIIKRLCVNKYHSIGISTTLYVSFMPIIEIIDFIRKYDKSIKIILGGPFVFNVVKQYDKFTLEYLLLQIGADVFINSMQGEQALVNSIINIKKGKSLRYVDNIIYIENRKIYFNNMYPENNQLCENMVDWSLFSHDIGKYVALRTSISCPFNCKFCTFPKHAGKYQAVNVNAIAYELDSLSKINKIERIHFIDDTFNIPPERFQQLLKMMIERKYNFKWHSYARCQFLDEETVKLMKESGVEGVFLGIESGSQTILNNMNKRVKVEDYKRGIQLLKKYNIITFASYIIGFPGETEKTVDETIDFIKSVKTDFWRAQLWYGEVLSDVYQEKEKYNIIGSQYSWKHNTMDSKQANKILIKMFKDIRTCLHKKNMV